MNPNYQIVAVRLATDVNPNYQHISMVRCRYVDLLTRQTLIGDFDRQYIANQIEDGQATAHVQIPGTTVGVMVERWPNGNKYLRTHSDNTRADNLLSLPRF